MAWPPAVDGESWTRRVEKRLGWLERRPGAPSGSATAAPSGMLAPFAGATAPEGWLLCDGSAVSRADYALLFDAIGTTYGVGNGTTTFNLPNLKGRIPVGRDAAQTEFDVLGETGGEKAHVLTTPEMPSHTHAPAEGGSFIATGAGSSNQNWVGTAASFHINTTTAATGGGGAHNNLQPYVVMNWIIRL